MADADVRGRASRRWIGPVLILSFCHAAAIANAQIVNIVVDPIKISLSASDTQISLLQGFAVAIAAAILGLPIGRWADRGNRRQILLIGITLWSTASVACGLAQSFGFLLLARGLVGVGEVFLFPVAFSMIADLAPPDRLSRAIALFSCGGPVGAAGALAGGGWLLGSGGTTILLGLEPWREVFLAGGVFGAVALLLVTRLKEPERGAAKFKVRGFGQTLHLFRRHARAYSGTLLGLLALSLAVFATIAWSPTLLIRGHGFSPVSAGGFAGLASLLCALPGTWLAGALSDALDTPRRPDGVILTAIGMSVLLIPVMLTVGLARSSAIAATFLCLGYALLSMPTVLGGTVIQQLSPPDLRARLTAVYVLLVNLVALGAGPTAVAMLSDRLLGKDKLGSALAAVTSMAAMVAILSFLWARRSFVQKRYQDGGVRSISSISA